jgi:hypothetical protein
VVGPDRCGTGPAIALIVVVHWNELQKAPLATPNYGYEKRQKELAKKKKKEDKLLAKSERKNNPRDEITTPQTDAHNRESTPDIAPQLL